MLLAVRRAVLAHFAWQRIVPLLAESAGSLATCPGLVPFRHHAANGYSLCLASTPPLGLGLTAGVRDLRDRNAHDPPPRRSVG